MHAIYFACIYITSLFMNTFIHVLNPIPAGGGGVNFTPLYLFLHNSKSISLGLLNFFYFSFIPKALPLGLKPGFNTNCLSPQAHCLNDCFFCNKLNLCFDPLSVVRF